MEGGGHQSGEDCTRRVSCACHIMLLPACRLLLDKIPVAQQEVLCS